MREGSGECSRARPRPKSGMPQTGERELKRCGKSLFSKSTYPHRGEGCGDTLNDWTFSEKRSNFVQEAPPFYNFTIFALRGDNGCEVGIEFSHELPGV